MDFFFFFFLFLSRSCLIKKWADRWEKQMQEHWWNGEFRSKSKVLYKHLTYEQQKERTTSLSSFRKLPLALSYFQAKPSGIFLGLVLLDLKFGLNNQVLNSIHHHSIFTSHEYIQEILYILYVCVCVYIRIQVRVLIFNFNLFFYHTCVCARDNVGLSSKKNKKCRFVKTLVWLLK